MKQLFKLIMGGMLLMAMPLMMTSCEGALDDIFGEWSRPGTVTSISLTSTTLTLVVGEADVTLSFTLKPDNAIDKTVTWSSDNTAVATVDATGRVHAVAVGTATITAKAGDKTASCTVTVTEVYAANEYNEASWNGTKVVFTKHSAMSVTAVANSDANVTWDAGWYTVSGEVTITGTVTLGADTHLILCDGAKLTINGCLYGSDMYKLHIYGQANQTGQLVVNSTIDAIFGITTLEVHSSKVTATSSHDGDAGLYNIGTFNVYGGSIDAESTTTGTGGYGISLKDNGSMNIYGGDVKAVGKKAYGIRTEGSPATFTVYGGQLWAECAENMALDDHVTLAKGDGFTGKIETSGDGSSWTEYTTLPGTPTTKYVRAGY